jgi:UDP-N-acetylglucosamine/UDP-N-acetylgalactosamine diphosphorylase
MLDQPRIFLGGQGGAVGPVRVGYGTVVAAGSVLRRDVPADGRLVASGAHRGLEREYVPHSYPGLPRVVENNVVYLANLVALEQWYRRVRRPFFAAQDLGDLVFEGALAVLTAAKHERAARLAALAAKVRPADDGRRTLRERAGEVGELFAAEPPIAGRDAFLAAFEAALDDGESPADLTQYTQTIQALPAGAAALGVAWLQQIVDTLCGQAAALLRPLGLFRSND